MFIYKTSVLRDYVGLLPADEAKIFLRWTPHAANYQIIEKMIYTGQVLKIIYKTYQSFTESYTAKTPYKDHLDIVNLSDRCELVITKEHKDYICKCLDAINAKPPGTDK